MESPALAIVIIDANDLRRHLVVRAVAALGIACEGFAEPGQSPAAPEGDCVYFVEHAGRFVSTLRQHLADLPAMPPIIGFSPNPTVEEVLTAVMDGASDYLAWPATAREIEQAARSAVSRGRWTDGRVTCGASALGLVHVAPFAQGAKSDGGYLPATPQGMDAVKSAAQDLVENKGAADTSED